MNTISSRLCAAILASFAGAASAFAGPVLTIEGSSLTNYRAGVTSVQGVQPQYEQRGSTLEGAERPGLLMIAPAPVTEAPQECQPPLMSGILDLSTLTYSAAEVDLAIPTDGPMVFVGRTYNNRQGDGRKVHGSFGPQGQNWFQSAQPEIVLVDEIPGSGSTPTKPAMVYLVVGANRHYEFAESSSGSGVYLGCNGSNAAFQKTAGNGTTTYDTYTVTDHSGNRMVFWGSNAPANVRGQWWKTIDPQGRAAYAGNASSHTSAVGSSGYTTAGGIATIFQQYGTASSPAERRYTFTYTTISGKDMLTQVSVETSANWSASPLVKSEIGRVNYSYYTSNTVSGSDSTDTFGDTGDLQTVKVRQPLTDSGSTLDSGVYHQTTRYYRYYTGINPGGDDIPTNRRGHPHCVKLILGAEGARRFDWQDDSTFNDSFTDKSVPTEDLKPYCEAWFEYESDPNQQRISTAIFNGECGCGASSAIAGIYTFKPEDNPSAVSFSNLVYDNSWAKRTVIGQPDGSYSTRYFDETGQALSTVLTNGDPAASYSQIWVTGIVRNSSGLITEVHSPANVDTYTHGSSTAPDGTITFKASEGLVTLYERTTSTPDADLVGLVKAVKFQTGSSGSPTTLSETTYTSRSITVGSGSTKRPLISKQRNWVDATNYEDIDYSYDLWWSTTTTDPLYGAIKQMTTTYPAVSTTKNGEGVTHTVISYSRKDGRTAFIKARDGIYSAMTYNELGRVAKSVQDADLSLSIYDTGYTPSDFSISSSGTPLHYLTEYAYDSIGRGTTTTIPSGRVMATYYSKLGDGRLATLAFPRKVSSTYYGPASYAVTNHAGRSELQTTLGVTSISSAMTGWINESTADPLDALDSSLTGSGRSAVSKLRISNYDISGIHKLESRDYVNVVSSGSWLGSAGINYDLTQLVYDNMGRLSKVVDPSSTVVRTTFDAAGRPISIWLGTDDAGFDPSGTSTGNMVQVGRVEYDAGAGGGNSYLTKRIGFVESASNGVGASGTQRMTEYKNDVRGNAIAVLNPEKPHVVNAYDLLRRVTATATYNSPSGLSASSVPTTTSGRLSYFESFFDERGQGFKSTRHEIVQSGGSPGTSTDSLDSLFWYDSVGRQIKVGGGQNTKRFYDRLGRVTNHFDLARNNDTAYADASTVSGDVVLEESQTVYDDADKTGNVVLSVSMSRPHTDTSGTGALDSNADSNRYKVTAANLAGRAQITAMWYDDLDRPIERVAVGDNGGSDYDRRPGGSWASVPSRSSTVLRTSTVYNANGTVQQVQAPRERSAGNPIATKYEYDAAGRKVTEIRNYTAGLTSTANRDNDIYTRYVYTNSLMTKMWVDLNGNGTEDSDDQVTEYVYGQNKGAGATNSKVADNRLLKQVKYPPASSGASDASRSQYFAYNALGQKIYKKDQNGTEHAYEYDNAGKFLHDRVTTLASGVDGAVRRITTAYEDRGMVQTVTQFDNATVGSGSATDEVKYTYDGWGNVLTYQEDRDSTVGSGTANDYGVVYTYAKADDTGTASGTKRRSGVRRTISNLQYAGTNIQQINYQYDSTGGLLDADSGRVTRLTIGSSSPVDIAEYRYLGSGMVVDTKLSQPDLICRLHTGASTANYSGYLDRFNRVTTSKWQRSTSGKFYEVGISYDNNSNITAVEDKWVTSWSVVYDLDNLDRVVRANGGTLASGSISTTYLDEKWKNTSTGAINLSQTGNWSQYTRIRSGVSEADEASTFNQVNQITLRDTDGTGSTAGNQTPVYDNAGNLTDDDGRTTPASGTYEYVYDAWNRLRKVNRQSGTNPLVAEYRYNGLGHRIGWHYDSTQSGGGAPDGVVDSNDPWFYFAYNERWQQVAMYVGGATTPKETFVYHEAGRDGSGSSSYIDAVVLRDRDTTGGGTRGERNYYLQNWRYDVVLLVKSNSYLLERYHYNVYGRPESYSPADVAKLGGAANPDGQLTADDAAAFNSAWFAGTATFQCDLVQVGASAGPDGSVSVDDYFEFYSSRFFYSGYSGGIGLQSDPSIDNRKGYAGYEFDPVLAGSGGATSQAKFHVRNRVLDCSTGRWIQEDPLGYVDGPSLYAYCNAEAIKWTDSTGTQPNDKYFGLPDEFWKWYHRQWKDSFSPDLTKEEAEELYKRWLRMGKPRGDGKGKWRRGCGSIGIVLLLMDYVANTDAIASELNTNRNCKLFLGELTRSAEDGKCSPSLLKYGNECCEDLKANSKSEAAWAWCVMYMEKVNSACQNPGGGKKEDPKKEEPPKDSPKKDEPKKPSSPPLNGNAA